MFRGALRGFVVLACLISLAACDDETSPAADAGRDAGAAFGAFEGSVEDLAREACACDPGGPACSAATASGLNLECVRDAVDADSKSYLECVNAAVKTAATCVAAADCDPAKLRACGWSTSKATLEANVIAKCGEPPAALARCTSTGGGGSGGTSGGSGGAGGSAGTSGGSGGAGGTGDEDAGVLPDGGMKPRCGNGAVEDGEDCDPGSDKCCNATCDGVKAAGTVCRDKHGACDVAEECDGDDAACPSDDVASDTTVCREADGECDVAEECDGEHKSCPSNEFKSDATECRATSGACDVAEKCTGSDADCPADAVKTDTATCRAQSGACDVAEKCDGANKSCPSDGVRADTYVCQASAGGCDDDDKCNGSSKSCPSDTDLCSTGEGCEIDDECASADCGGCDAYGANCSSCDPYGGNCTCL